MSEFDKDMIKDEVRKAIKEMLDPIMRETLKEIERQVKTISLRINLSKEDLDMAEPTSIVLRDIANIIKESIRKGLREKGEEMIDEMILNLSELKAGMIMKSLANEDRIKLLKILYKNPMSFSELKEKLNLESSSLSYNLRQLLSTGLIVHDETVMKYKISSRGKMLLRLLALIHETLGGEIHE